MAGRDADGAAPGTYSGQESGRTSRSGRRREPRDGDKRKVNVNRDTGAELELRVARLEFAEGAFSRMRVPARAEEALPGKDVLTDLDILAIDVDPRLRVSRSTLECKGEKGEAKEAERLFCLSGLRQYLAVQRAVLVRPTVSRRGRALARRLDIGIMDIPTLERREAAHAWLPMKFAHL